MKERKQNIIVKEVLLIAGGTALIAFAIASVYDPAGMITGGFPAWRLWLSSLQNRWFPEGFRWP